MNSNNQFSSTLCIICNQESDEPLTNVTRGIKTLLESALARKDMRLQEYLQSNPFEISVHNSCRKRFTDLRGKRTNNNGGGDLECGKKLRSSVEATFSWKTMCFLCDKKIESKEQSRQVSTIEIKETLISHCKARCGDEWSMNVEARLCVCNDLVAEEAVYHVYCYNRFSRHKTLNADSAAGRPKNAVLSELFESLCEWLESGSDDELHTLEELRMWMVREYMAVVGSDNKLTESVADDAVYSVKHLKRKLLMRYGDHVFFSFLAGKRNILCFRDMCSYIINEHHERLLHGDNDSERIVKLAGKLIAAQLHELSTNLNSYPTKQDMASDDMKCIPSLLQLLLGILVPNKLKQVGIGQAIVQAAKPRSYISPLLLGLALKFDAQHGSEDLLISLARVGFGVSYDEVVRYKQSVVMSEEPGKSRVTGYPPVFTQWVADNVDHNIRTLDGLNTFHGAGVISVSASPQANVIIPDHVIPRLTR